MTSPLTSHTPSALPDEFAVRRILVVDDDPDINRLLRIRLERRGFDIVSAASGEEALDEVAATRPDLIFLDISMPGMSGLDVLGKLRGAGHETGIIMTTAFGSEQTAVEALRQGADDYLRKPFETAELQTVLDRTVRRVELSRTNAWLRAELDEKHRRLQEELQRAARVQADLIPARVPETPGFEVQGMCIPALEVGGDFYDWEILGNRFAFVVADVMGKGMAAALLMATVRSALRAAAGYRAPGDAMRRTARAIERDLMHSGAFVTLFLGHVNLDTGTLSYVDAGHGYGSIWRASGAVERLPVSGYPLGAVEGAEYEEVTVDLFPGDAVIVCSDGLAEEAPEVLGGPHSVGLDWPSDLATVVRVLAARAGPVESLGDDLTIVAVRRLLEG